VGYCFSALLDDDFERDRVQIFENIFINILP